MALRSMKSRYNAKCKVCGETITLGDEILWSKDTGAMHPGCAEKQQSGEGSSQSEGTEIPSSGEKFTPEIPGTTERNNETYFTVDWRNLRETVKAALRGDSLKMRKHNADKVESHTAKVRNFHGYTRNQLTRWVEDGFSSGAIHGLGDFTPPLREKRHYIFNEDGDEIHVDRALSGEDNYAGDWTQRERIPGVSIEAEIMFASLVKAEIVNAYNVWICRAIYALESAGIDCQVTLKFSSQNATGESKMNHTIVKVKSENEQTDFQAFSPMVSPAALRTFGFVAIILHAESRGKNVMSGLGHGRNGVRPTPEWKVIWDAERRVLKFDCPYMPNHFPAEKMDAEFRTALRSMKGN